MKQKDIQALHLKSVAELTKELEAKKADLNKYQLEKQVKPEKNTRKKRDLKDEIARIATILGEVKLKEKQA